MSLVTWKTPISDWIAALEIKVAERWNDELASASLLASLRTRGIAIPHGNDHLSSNRFYALLEAVSNKIGSGSSKQSGKLSKAAWKKAHQEGQGTSQPLHVAEVFAFFFEVLGYPRCAEPWSHESLPETLLPKTPWPARFELKKLFHPALKADFGDTADVISSITKPVCYFAGLHTGEHLRDLIEVMLANPHLKQLILRGVSCDFLDLASKSLRLLPEWFVGSLAMNLMIVQKKIFAERGRRRDLDVKVVPYVGLPESMGALIATMEEDFSKVQGIFYSGVWSIATKSVSTEDDKSTSVFLGPDREMPIQRLSLNSQAPRYRLSSIDDKPLTGQEALNAGGAGGNTHDSNEAPESETEGQYARRRARLLWLPESKYRHGLSIEEYVKSILAYEGLIRDIICPTKAANRNRGSKGKPRS